MGLLYIKKLIVGIGVAICGLIILCTDYILKSVIAAMPNIHLIDGAAIFSLSVMGWILIGIVVAILGYNKE